MTPFPWFDLLVIAGLILLNGLFAMSELAIVSARSSRLRAAADRGNRSAQTALELAAEPGRFLSTVQIGITLVGILAGAYSGASLGGPVGERLAAIGMPVLAAEQLGFALVIIVVTFSSLIVGELVPKQIALRAAEPIALAMARPMALLARSLAPFVWLLDTSSAAMLRLLGLHRPGAAQLTAEELHMIFAEATRAGAIEEGERALMSGVLRLAERPVRELMTPRTELDWIDRQAGTEELRAVIARSPHALLPVAQGTPDRIVGVIKVRDALAAMLAGQQPDIGALMKRCEIIPDQLDALDALRILQQAEIGMGMVHDEYGNFEGIVTPTDLLTAIAGAFASDRDEGDAPYLVEREDGSLLLSGAMPADAMAERLAIALPADREYATVAGYALSVLRRLPREGDHFIDQGWRFEVVDMDGRRIDKLLAERIAMPSGTADGEGAQG
ncbi:MAG: hemolysin family protein [Novosphingobium sp.]|nr:hemolysin family protein [Novosphingobium sp.]